MKLILLFNIMFLQNNNNQSKNMTEFFLSPYFTSDHPNFINILFSSKFPILQQQSHFEKVDCRKGVGVQAMIQYLKTEVKEGNALSELDKYKWHRGDKSI